MGFLPSCGCVNTTVWIYHMDVNKMHKEKARWELNKNATFCFEQVLEATPHKTATIQSLPSHLKNHPSKMSKTCRTLLEKQGQTLK